MRSEKNFPLLVRFKSVECMTNELSDNLSSSSSTAASFENVVDQIWRAIVATDIEPTLSHVEVMFGSGSEPWNGVSQRRVTYYLTSQRVNELALLSFALCDQLCPPQFPQCFRVDYTPNSHVSQDATNRSMNEPTQLRQCGRLFAKNKSGLRQALLMARYMHAKAALHQSEQWATLVQYAKNGAYRVLKVWSALQHDWPRTSVVGRMLAKTHYSICHSTLVLLGQILAGIAILILVLALIALIGDAFRQRKAPLPASNSVRKTDAASAAAFAAERQQRRQARELLMGQTVFYDDEE